MDVLRQFWAKQNYHTLLGESLNMNAPFSSNTAPLYRNALEPLVIKEVDRQVNRLPAKLLKYVDIDKIKAQAIAYALNRLPAMYATSERGWEFQQLKAQEKYRRKIAEVVRQAFAAVQRDPLMPVWSIFAPESSYLVH